MSIRSSKDSLFTKISHQLPNVITYKKMAIKSFISIVNAPNRIDINS